VKRKATKDAKKKAKREANNEAAPKNEDNKQV
jgi:hypothetical protein